METTKIVDSSLRLFSITVNAHCLKSSRHKKAPGGAVRKFILIEPEIHFFFFLKKE
jgi:hypothetical protein